MATTQLELSTADGPVYRDVLQSPPREARRDEVPIIDLSQIDGDDKAKMQIARLVRQAAENTGFFYIRNHGVSAKAIHGALSATEEFFAQPDEAKLRASKDKGKYFSGFSAKRSGAVSRTEGADYREAFMWYYQPEFDPNHQDSTSIPDGVKERLRGEQYIWDATSHLPQFQARCVKYWQECLQLARKLMGIFALGLNLPEDYFDPLTTYPGADCVLSYYPAMSLEQVEKSTDIGIGSHTDLQCFTLLWQDEIGGLQVLTKEGQWLKVSPITDTIVVNIGDFLMRLTNDRFKSTVHRVYNRSTVERYSLPFFFGFNFNEQCGVLPSCVDENNPAKYEPVSCGDWCLRRFQQDKARAS